MSALAEIRRWWQAKSAENLSRFDQDRVAWATSFLIHLCLLFALAAGSLILPTRHRIELVASPAPLEEELVPNEFQFSDVVEVDVGALGASGSNSARPVAMNLSDRSQVAVELEPLDTVGDLAVSPIEQPLWEGLESHEEVVLQGEGSVGVAAAAGAIDRITHEILLSLEQRPTLVVWMFDQSGSLREQRESIVKRFDRVYRELGVIQDADHAAFTRHVDTPLLTEVRQFGAGLVRLTRKPTSDLEQIKAAVKSVRDDPSGQENVFQAVLATVKDFRGWRLNARKRRNVMLVVFTDEAGDDVSHLDLAVENCRLYQMPVYVVGVPAPFGRRDVMVRYVDPDPQFDQSPQWLPVAQGPESLMPERLKLYFTGDGRRDDMLASGFGPFGLTRLCFETGGIYFMVHPDHGNGRTFARWSQPAATAVAFDRQIMRRYRPDYTSRQEYLALLKKNRTRNALVQAAAISWTTPMQNVRLVFPKASDAELANLLSLAQREAAKLEPKIRLVCDTLRAGEATRPQLVKPRWQAGFDLAMGRALAVKVRTEAYNATLARAKQGMQFANPRSDTWVLAPAEEIDVSSALEKQADQARAYLKRVVAEHAETPWAMLAERELTTPMGWRWTERYTGVQARRQRQMANNNQPRRPRAPRPSSPQKPRRTPAL